MTSHRSIWVAIDALAARHSLSVSGLARRAGLDPTAFNPSKRIGKDGRERWPSTESIAKILRVTGEEFYEFFAHAHAPRQNIDRADGTDRRTGPSDPSAEPMSLAGAGMHYAQPAATVPLLGFAQAGAGGYFDAAGFPVGQGWDQVTFPVAGNAEAGTYALEVSGDSMEPAYRDGDILIVSPTRQLRRGDRVVVRTLDGEVTAKVLFRQTENEVELHSLNPDHAPRTLKRKEIDWIARILWASQ